MPKSNIYKDIEKNLCDNDELHNFLWKMIDYYIKLRGSTDLNLAIEIGMAKSTFSTRRNSRTPLMPREIEQIISALQIEDLDANRIRAKYWAALAGMQFQQQCSMEFNRLYARDTESLIRELWFENEILKEKSQISESTSFVEELLINKSIEFMKPKP